MSTSSGMTSATAAKRSVLALLGATFILVVLVFQSLATALFLAGVLAAVLAPLHRRLSRLLWSHRQVAAGVMTVCAVAVILIPLVSFSAFVVREASEASKFVAETVRSEGVDGLIGHLPDGVEKLVRGALDKLPLPEGQELNDKVQETVGERGGQAAAAVRAAVGATGSFVFQAAMMLIAFFFFLTEKEEIMQWVDEASPLRRGQTRELLKEFRQVSSAVMRSSILTAAIQAAAALVGYFIARVPHPLFFAGVTFFIAFVPAMGAASVCLAAALLLFGTGHPYMALFLAIWGVAVVGLVDNVVKPLLMKDDVHMNGVVVFFALIGGLTTFGPIGLLVGPLAVALFIAVLRMYRRDYGEPTAKSGEPVRKPFTDPKEPRATPHPAAPEPKPLT
ncbi:MAG: AI-2E family transporter [Myxococcaceae bacterium]